MVIGNDSANGHPTVLALPLKWKEGDSRALVANDGYLDVAAHRSHGLNVFRRKERIVQLRIAFLETSPRLNMMRAQPIPRQHLNIEGTHFVVPIRSFLAKAMRTGNGLHNF